MYLKMFTNKKQMIEFYNNLLISNDLKINIEQYCETFFDLKNTLVLHYSFVNDEEFDRYFFEILQGAFLRLGEGSPFQGDVYDDIKNVLVREAEKANFNKIEDLSLLINFMKDAGMEHFKNAQNIIREIGNTEKLDF
ncbi:MAG: hypothetical protein GY909_15720 [Oligoflexia bacterium]|nr:hypothetical protein [Oligoflexia bacterium]